MDGSTKTKIKILSLSGYTNGTCGYCSKPNKWVTCGFSANSITLHEHQELMDRGWRRSGDYFYKINLAKTCCKAYTIRLDVNKFIMSASQRKILKRFDKYLTDGVRKVKSNKAPSNSTQEKPTTTTTNTTENLPQNKTQDNPSQKPKKNEPITTNEQVEIENLGKAFAQKFLDGYKTNVQCLGLEQPEKFIFTQDMMPGIKAIKSNSPKFVEYYLNVLLVIHSKNKKLVTIEALTSRFKETLNKFLEGKKPKDLYYIIRDNGYIWFSHTDFNELNNEVNENDEEKKNNECNGKINGKVMSPKKEKKVNGKIAPKEEKKSNPKTSKDPKNTEKTKEKLTSNKPSSKKHNITMKLVKPEADGESFRLYKKYCEAIHKKNEETKADYESFLCKKVFNYAKHKNGDKVLELGCYHMKYYLDNRLFAVGVVDIAPESLSSVYFFYDPDYKDFSIGIWGVLQEIQYMQEISKHFPEFKYYCLGFYIQNNPKMTYKGDFEPSELLCPITYTWVTLDDKIRKLIDEAKTIRLSSNEVKAIDDMNVTKSDMDHIMMSDMHLLIKDTAMKLAQLPSRQLKEHLMQVLKDIIPALGKGLSRSLVFIH